MNEDPDEIIHANGKTPAEEATEEVRKDFDKPAAPELPEERARRFKTPGFSRMNLTWQGEDARVMALVKLRVNDLIGEQFSDAFDIMHAFYDLVREPVTVDGVPQEDQHGLTVWKRTPTGGYIEHWDKITHRDREKFLYLITTRLFDWQQRAADAWAEAMMSKGIFEERFADGFRSLPPVSATRPTVDDRKAKGSSDAAESRYFAILWSYYSRKADAICRVMELLSQRLKDVHTV